VVEEVRLQELPPLPAVQAVVVKAVLLLAVLEPLVKAMMVAMQIAI
tara:strand:+ start:278 stop:415 length:138 start_codon:yes stop_codon:yes gene_type:complete